MTSKGCGVGDKEGRHIRFWIEPTLGFLLSFANLVWNVRRMVADT